MGPLQGQLKVSRLVQSVAVSMFPLLVSSVRILASSLGSSHPQELELALQERESQAESASLKA